MRDDHTSWIPVPPSGPGRIRALLANLDEDPKKLDSHPLYREGYLDGKTEATRNYKKMMAAMAAIYQLDVEE